MYEIFILLLIYYIFYFFEHILCAQTRFRRWGCNTEGKHDSNNLKKKTTGPPHNGDVMFGR